MVDAHATGALDKGAGTQVKRPQTHAAPCRVFPELIAEEAEPGEDQVYGAGAELAVEWRERRRKQELDWRRRALRRLRWRLSLA